VKWHLEPFVRGSCRNTLFHVCGRQSGPRTATSPIRVVPAEHVACVIDQLRPVSDDWLARHTAAEKGFSLGFFAPEYLARFPVAVIERDGRIVAFANLWQGAERFERSVDLMRYDHRAPKDVIDALLVHLLLNQQAVDAIPAFAIHSRSAAPRFSRPKYTLRRGRAREQPCHHRGDRRT
jgi:phosphatidylglycerol lysyltransferase